MEYNKEKVDEITLALLYLVTHEEEAGCRAWKNFDWQTMDRLHRKGYISDPKTKAKSVVIFDDAVKRSEELFKKYFAK